MGVIQMLEWAEESKEVQWSLTKGSTSLIEKYDPDLTPSVTLRSHSVANNMHVPSTQRKPSGINQRQMSFSVRIHIKKGLPTSFQGVITSASAKYLESLRVHIHTSSTATLPAL
jgi:hypothetical protein